MVSPEVKKYLEDEIQKAVSFDDLRKKFMDLLSKEPLFQFAEFDVIKKFLARKQWSAEEISEILKEISAMEEKWLEAERIKLQEKKIMEAEMKAESEKAADEKQISQMGGEVISKEVLLKKAEMEEIERKKMEAEKENKLKIQLEEIERTQKELFQKELSRAISAGKEEPPKKEAAEIVEILSKTRKETEEKAELDADIPDDSPEIVIPAAFIKREIPPKKPFFTRVKSRFSVARLKFSEKINKIKLGIREKIHWLKDVFSNFRQQSINFIKRLFKKFISAIFVKKAKVLEKEKSKVFEQKPKEREKRLDIVAPESSQAKINLVETKIIGKWLAAIGTIIFIFGIILLLKYILENNFIGIAERVMFGIVIGFIFLFVGDFFSKDKKYSQRSFVISGGGLIIVSVSIYASFNLYHLIGQLAAFCLMVIAAAVGILFSLKSNSKGLAALSLICGFLAPILVLMDKGPFLLFNYILILNFIFLVLSYVKKWKFIFVLEPFLIYPVFYWWLMKFYGMSAFIPAAFFLNVFFLFFLALVFFLNLSKEKKFSKSDAAVGIFNVIFYFPAAYYILKPNNIFVGALFLIWSAAHLAGAYLIYKINPENKKAILFFGGIGMLLLTLFVPVQFDGMRSVEILTIESLILIWLGFQFKNFPVRIFANFTLLFAVAYLLLFEISAKGPIGSIVFINERILLFLFMAVALFLASCFYKQYADARKKGEEHISKIFDAAANLIAVLILSLESISFFDKMVGNINSSNEYYLLIKNLRNFSLSAVWGVYSAILMLVGILRNYKALRTVSLIGFGAVILKALSYDIFWLASWFKIGLFIVLGFALLVFSFLYRRKFTPSQK